MGDYLERLKEQKAYRDEAYRTTYKKWYETWNGLGISTKRMIIESMVRDFSAYLDTSGIWAEYGYVDGESYGVVFPGMKFIEDVEFPLEDDRFYNWYHDERYPGILVPNKNNMLEEYPVVAIRENMYENENIISKRQLLLSVFEEIMLCHYYRSVDYMERDIFKELGFGEFDHPIVSHLDDKKDPITPWPLIVPAYYKKDTKYNMPKAISIYFNNKAVDEIINRVPKIAYKIFGEFFGSEIAAAVSERKEIVKEYTKEYEFETARIREHNAKILEAKTMFENQQAYLHDIMIKLGFCAGCPKNINHPYIKKDKSEPDCVCDALANEEVFIAKP